MQLRRLHAQSSWFYYDEERNELTQLDGCFDAFYFLLIKFIYI